ncbi:MAG: TfoX/Sxy family protein [Ignavibacteria bacterium]|nr:TfoX/Sxy family protein [Ignavibacteria bacterium]
MAYSEKLAERITELLSSNKKLVIKKMFGGICYMLKEKMIAGIVEDKLMIRCLKEDYESLLNKPHAAVMTFTGKPMKGFLYVEPEGIRTNKQLQKWLDVGIEFAHKSPPKKKKIQK